MSQRKAWNEAMRSAAGASALPPDIAAKNTKRRSDRRKKQDRRGKARKVQSFGFGDGPEGKEILAAAWMDALEDIHPMSGIVGGDEGDDSYDELDELLDGAEGGSKKRGRRAPSKKVATAGVLPKRFKPRSVASILLEDINREDGAARQWLNTEARNTTTTSQPSSSQKSQAPVLVPARKFCPVTGMEGIYTEPKSGIPFANLKALEQIQERPPPWMTLGGTLAYYEAVKSIRDED